MASSCVNNVGTHSSYGWTTPNVSFISSSSIDNKHSDTKLEKEDTDFEFLLEDPVTMLSADQLFSEGKLVPLKFSGTTSEKGKGVERREGGERSCGRIEMEIFSPKAPSCTASWRELLGLKKTQDSSSSSSSSSPNSKSSLFRHFLQRSSKSTASSTPTPPLLKDSEMSESASISSARLSLSSSSSSGHELDDLPRLSLDLDKPAPNPFAPGRGQLRNTKQQRIRMSKPRRHSQPQADKSMESMGNGESRGMTVTADSPRLNASGKLVFHGLERSSSSSGNFTGGPRMKQPHGMPRSYSTNVRITPLLNVPVSSLRGSAKSGISFAQLFSSSSSPGNRSVQLQSSSKNRSNRTKLEPTSEV